MHKLATDEELSLPKSVVTGHVAQLRMLTGILQGAVLYLLYLSLKSWSWPATNGYFFAPALMIALFVPVLLISALGHLQKRRLLIWMAIVTLICILLGVCDIWRAGPLMSDWWGLHNSSSRVVPSGQLIFFATIGLVIAHALVLAGANDQRLIARYPSYFEISWKLAIQIMFSVLFVGVLWAILWLGAALFMLVKLNFFRELLQHAWFWIPVTAFAFSTALHLTDARPGIVRGIRSLLLVLLSWLLPITTLIVGGFLLSLPFTGLEPLWATRHATSVLLGAASVLVLLINAAFQDGELDKQIARVLRITARVASVLLLPITLIAVYSLTLRVEQYGWTSDRVIAAACLLVAISYSCGYLWAAFERGVWLTRIASTNIITAFLTLVILLGLFTPLADPARLSVSDQLARLATGKISASNFDFDYLRLEGVRYGDAALQKMKIATVGVDAETIRTDAEAALKKINKYGQRETAAASDATSRAANITVWPHNIVLPATFTNQSWPDQEKQYLLPLCLKNKDNKCDAYLIDMNGDGHKDILLKNSGSYSQLILFVLGADGKWEPRGTTGNGYYNCDAMWQALAAGDYKLATPEFKDLEIAGQRLQIEPWFSGRENCPKKK
jgi:hypothetical protein